MNFAPAGLTDDDEIRTASSLVDYVFRRLAQDYLSFDDRLELGLASFDDQPVEQVSLLKTEEVSERNQPLIVDEALELPELPPVVIDEEPTQPPVQEPVKASEPVRTETAPLCYNCGNQTQRAGSCYVCTACGTTTGCS